MDVLVINGSPRKDRGQTANLAALFTEGMQEAGASVEFIYSAGLEINDCRGCFNCWGNTPGVCIQKDEMSDVLDQIANADILVLATPVYVDGMTGSLKTLIDRTIPLLHGRFEIRDDHCRHPLRTPVKNGKIVLLSVSGFHELDNFDSLVHHVRAISKNLNREFAGAVLRPIAWAMAGAKDQGVLVDDIYNAIKEAGRELIAEGIIREEILSTISRDYMPRDVAVRLMQGFYQDK